MDHDLVIHDPAGGTECEGVLVQRVHPVAGTAAGPRFQAARIESFFLDSAALKA